LISTSYKIVSNILLSMLSPYVDVSIGDHHRCGFRRNRPTTEQIFCIRQILEKKGSTVRQYIFIDFKKACDSVRREVLYSILIEFGVPMKLVRLIKMCLNQTYTRIGKRLSGTVPIPILDSKRWRCFIAIAFQLCFRICH
jgi:hypothetical protein